MAGLFGQSTKANKQLFGGAAAPAKAAPASSIVPAPQSSALFKPASNAKVTVAPAALRDPNFDTRIRMQFNPTTSAIDFYAPDYFLESPEYKEFVLPQLETLVGKDVNDNTVKAIIDSGFISDLQKASDETVLPRYQAIQDYKQQFKKATDDDALTYLRNVAAAERSDKDKNTQLVVGTDDKGKAVTQSVNSLMAEWKTMGDSEKAARVKAVQEIVEKGSYQGKEVSELDRAASAGTIEFLKKKGLLEASGGTKFDLAIKRGIEALGNSGIGTIASIPSGLFNLAVDGKYQTAGQQAGEQVRNDPRRVLNNAEQFSSTVAAPTELLGVGADLALSAVGGRALTAGAGRIAPAVTNAASRVAPTAVIEFTGRGTQVANSIGKLPGGAAIVRNSVQLGKDVPSNVVWGGLQTVADPDGYDAGGDFMLNTLYGAAAIGGLKAAVRGFRGADTATQGALSSASDEVSKAIFRTVDQFQKIPIIGEKFMSAATKSVDDSAAYRRKFRNAFAYSKGSEQTKMTKQEYFKAYNLSRMASTRGVKLGDDIIQGTPEMNTAFKLRQTLDKDTLAQANRYIELRKNVAYAENGNLPISKKRLESLQEELASYADNPNLAIYDEYQAAINSANRQIADIEAQYGLTPDDIVKMADANPDLQKNYAYLQYDDEISKKLDIANKASGRTVKETKGLKGTKEGATLMDPLLALQDKIYFLSNWKVHNDVATLLADSVERLNLPGVRIVRDAQDVRALEELKFQAKDEKAFVDAAVNEAVDTLGGDLARLADDLEDFAGEGLTQLETRVNVVVEDMLQTIQEEPKLQNAMIDLMDTLGSGQDNAADIAAAGILQRQKAYLAKNMESKLSELAGEDRRTLVDMFKKSITERFDEALEGTDLTRRTGTKELYERANEIKRLKAQLEPQAAVSGPNFIPYFKDGYKGTIEVDDPNLMQYFMSNRSQGELNFIQKVMMNSSRIFRAGTTGFNPVFVGVVNPVRDIVRSTITSGNGIITPRNMVQSLMEAKGISSQAAANIADDVMARFDESVAFGTQVTTAREVGRSERQLEKTLRQGEIKDSTSKLKTVTLRVVDSMPSNGAFRNAEDLFNTVEVATRKNVFTSRFDAALRRGESVEAATQEAMFYAANGTTDFLNVGSKVDNMLKTLPYLSASINGKASFVRLATLDPIGVTMRIAYGAVFPAVWLTTRNLSDPERAATYAGLSEYDKNSNFIVVLDKDNILKIPLDYDVGGVIAPFRKLAESAMTSEDPDVAKMFMDSVLGASPVDLSGFSETDLAGNRDGLLGLSRLAANVVPQAIRPLYEGLSGKSMYTGSAIGPTDLELIDKGQIDPTQEITNADRTFASNDSAILGNVANFLGIPQFQAQNILKSYTGTVGQLLLNSLDKAVGAPESKQGGRDLAEDLTKRFTAKADGGKNRDYYDGIGALAEERTMLKRQLAKIDQSAQYDENPEGLAERRQGLIDAYGQKVSSFMDNFSRKYEGGEIFKATQLDALVDLLNLSDETGAFSEGSYQQGLADEVAQEAQNDATRRAIELGVPATSSRDMFGRMFNNDGELSVDYNNTSLYNDDMRARVYGAPKQIAFEFAEATKADRDAGIESLYDVKSRYDDRISDLYDSLDSVSASDKNRKNAIFEEIANVEKEYMNAFDERIKPLVEKYGVEVLGKSKIFDEISSYIMVPNSMTPFASKKKQPYLKEDAKAYLLDRYGIGKLNQENKLNDFEAEALMKEVNKDLEAGNIESGTFKLQGLEKDINNGRLFVNEETMADIEDMIYNLNSFKKRR